MSVFLLDRAWVRPGRLDDYRRGLRERYLPAARERGMTLVGSWLAPPVELEERPTELVVLWSLPDLASFWRMRGAAGADPEVAAWWEEAARMTSHRERQVLGALELEP